MEDDTEPRPESLRPYEDWIEAATRQVVAQAIAHVAENGLPGEHHFYLTFRTDHPGVVVPPRLRAQYLSFGGVPASLVIPLDAVTGFADPHVRYGLRFRAGTAPDAPEAPEPDAAEPEIEKPDATPQVVSLDSFRRRPTTKE
jgi:uncharacterized protein